MKEKPMDTDLETWDQESVAFGWNLACEVWRGMLRAEAARAREEARSVWLTYPQEEE